MSIHALSASSLATAPSCASKTRHAERREAVEPTEAQRRGPGALRGALDAAVTELAGAGAVRSEASTEALHDFTGALFEALRTEGGREVGHGPGRHLQRGYAWGRQGSGDLAQRIEALAARLEGAPAAGAAATTATPDAPAAAPTDALPAADAAVEPPATPAPAPAAAPAAPSELQAAYATLWQSLQPAGTEAATADLVGFLHTLAQRLGAAAAPALPVGSLVDTSA